MPKVVLDTNIFVSALFWRGKPYRVMRKCLQGEIELLVSGEILKEVKKVLTKEKKFELTSAEIEMYGRILRANSRLIHPNQKLKVVKEDPTDDKFVECAVAGKAEYIVSGDNHLLNLKSYQGIKIVTASQILRL